MEDSQKEKVIDSIENFYCNRLVELVDMKMVNEAHAVFEEFVVGDVDTPKEWFFIKEVEAQ